MSEAIPLTVIGGFLGAGKTTLVNHLLATAERRWGVLVNDFGAVNIDAALIAAADGDSIALANGCVCCEMGDDLGAALARLGARTPPPEHVIVEASGVGDPWRIAQLALIEPGFTLEPLVVLADATALHSQLDDPWIADTVRRQVEHAELLLLTKPDLAGEAACTRAEATLAALRPATPIRRIARGTVPAEALSFPTPARPTPSRFQADAPHPFVTWHFAPPAPLNRDRLRDALNALPPAILRIKGIAEYDDGQRLLLQYAARRWAFSDAPALPATGLVVIGTPNMPSAESLAALFAAAC